jgi:phosphoribosylformimino-5-aminoimidazole carboxamide ribotide isomerase
MQIYAAIDLKNGKCVRLRQGDPNAETVYGEDPAAMAETWAATGTDWLHVVNLDGAFGDPAQAAKNVDALQAILDRVNVPVQFGGGLRSPEDVRRALDMGVSRVVIGSMAADRPRQMIDILAEYGAEQVALGLDVRDGKVATHGWRQMADTSVADLVQIIQTAGLKHIIFTDIARDGMLNGINLAASVALAQAGIRAAENPSHRFKVIVSGGVAGIEDVKQVKANEASGLEGLIIGKALYDGKIDLAEALEIAHG